MPPRAVPDTFLGNTPSSGLWSGDDNHISSVDFGKSVSMAEVLDIVIFHSLRLLFLSPPPPDISSLGSCPIKHQQVGMEEQYFINAIHSWI